MLLFNKKNYYIPIMKQVATFILIFIMSNAMAQKQKVTNIEVADKFEKSYNQGEYEAIFNSFSPEMKNALPLEQTIEFLSGLKNKAGKIENKEFIRFHSSYALYKTT